MECPLADLETWCGDEWKSQLLGGGSGSAGDGEALSRRREHLEGGLVELGEQLLDLSEVELGLQRSVGISAVVAVKLLLEPPELAPP